MTLTLNFCYNSSAHDCLVQTSPQDVAGLKSNKPVSKLLRAFSRGSGIKEEHLDREARLLRVAKCFCHSRNQKQSSELFSGEDVVESIGLKDGDHVFVRRMKGDIEGKKEVKIEEIDKSDSGEFTFQLFTKEEWGQGKDLKIVGSYCMGNTRRDLHRRLTRLREL